MNNVAINFKMLCSLVKNRVDDNVYDIEVVTIKNNRFVTFDLEIIE